MIAEVLSYMWDTRKTRVKESFYIVLLLIFIQIIEVFSLRYLIKLSFIENIPTMTSFIIGSFKLLIYFLPLYLILKLADARYRYRYYNIKTLLKKMSFNKFVSFLLICLINPFTYIPFIMNFLYKAGINISYIGKLSMFLNLAIMLIILRFIFVPFLILDKDYNILKAIKISFQITKKEFFKMLIFSLIIYVLNILMAKILFFIYSLIPAPIIAMIIVRFIFAMLIYLPLMGSLYYYFELRRINNLK